MTTDYESYSNDIALDSYRISATLKSTGETKIGASVNIDPEKTVKAVGDLVDAYNSSIKLLNDNYGRGTGVDRQLRNLVNGLGSEKSLEKLGITVNKDATLKFDEDVLKKTMKEDPFLERTYFWLFRNREPGVQQGTGRLERKLQLTDQQGYRQCTGGRYDKQPVSGVQYVFEKRSLQHE